MLYLLYMAGAALILIGILFAFTSPKKADSQELLNYARDLDSWTYETLKLIVDGEVACTRIRSDDVEFDYKKALKNYQTPPMENMVKMVAELKIDKNDLG